jgi:hypothetical protein
LIIFTQIHQISLEHLIVVVITHELAHANHNIGKDTDNVEWTNMGSTELHIIEGLAQYYTTLFVENKKVFYPGLEIAYKKLLEYQSGPYRAHLDWLENYNKENVKHALFVAKRTGIKTEGDFDQFLHLSKEKLG